MTHRRIILLVCLAVGGTVCRAPAAPPKLRAYQTPHYLIYTDFGLEAEREAEVRLGRMIEEYERQTLLKTSVGSMPKLPLYLYGDPRDYYATGAPRASMGAFTGDALLAVAAPGDWHVVQHEGFHQFAAAVIGGRLPPWADEGWAEYFGESLFTGDGYVCGMIPPWRLRRLRQEIADGSLLPLSRLISMSQTDWNREFSLAHYDQVWSLVQFLRHGSSPAYRLALDDFVRRIASGERPPAALDHCFPDIPAIERDWNTYWLSLGDDPTPNVLARASVATLSSFLGRASIQRQRFDSFDLLARAAERGNLKLPRDQWLPPALAGQAVAAARAVGGTWSLELGTDGLPRVVVILANGERISGQFRLREGRVERVEVEQE